MSGRQTIVIATPLEAEHVEALRDVAPGRLEVLHEPELLPPTRYTADHKGRPSRVTQRRSRLGGRCWPRPTSSGTSRRPNCSTACRSCAGSRRPARASARWRRSSGWRSVVSPSPRRAACMPGRWLNGSSWRCCSMPVAWITCGGSRRRGVGCATAARIWPTVPCC
ncbi:hypothetical protein ACFQU7_33330 [Pseudoroseomonas wenyumeiae]